MFVLQVAAELKSRKVRFALVGGYALAAHGIVRATMDVDIVIALTEKSFLAAELSMKALGLTSRLPISAKDVAKFRREYIQNRNLIAWSFVDFQDPSRQVDILIIKDVADVEIERISFAGGPIPVASLATLLEMKLASNRAEDQLDIKKIRAKLAGNA